jgi:hypothetical protein
MDRKEIKGIEGSMSVKSGINAKVIRYSKNEAGLNEIK